MKKILSTVLMLSSISALGYGIGQSTYPMKPGKRVISTEFTGITSDNGGMGVQARFTQKVNQQLAVEAGIGISGGDREQRLFLGGDYELYPDYMRQPRISVKGSFERAQEFEVSKNQLTLAPTISKGMSFWGKEAFPYISMPIGLSLNTDDQSYESLTSLNAGINGQIPINGYRHLNGNAEVQLGINNSFTAVLVGVSFPMN